jgi:hypothetical protein
MKIICLDNHALIWGIREQSSEGQEDMVPHTKRFIESIDNDTSVLIPAIVFAEFLMPIPPELHPMVINLFNKNFIIAPFDALCASKFSLIWNKNKEEAQELVKKGITRAQLKADGLIVATAVARKAECIYSYDKWIKTFANGFVDVKEIPFIPEQKKLEL